MGPMKVISYYPPTWDKPNTYRHIRPKSLPPLLNTPPRFIADFKKQKLVYLRGAVPGNQCASIASSALIRGGCSG